MTIATDDTECDSQSDAETFVRSLLWDAHPECCGCPTVGGYYMGMSEEICCGQPEYDTLSDAQIVASLRERFPHVADTEDKALAHFESELDGRGYDRVSFMRGVRYALDSRVRDRKEPATGEPDGRSPERPGIGGIRGAQEAPATEPAAPAVQALTDEQIDRHTLRARDCPPGSSVMLVRSIRQLQARASVAPEQADAKDAARYRFLRDTPWSSVLDDVISMHRNARWDVEIDAAMAKREE